MATVAPLPHRSIYRGQHSDPLSPPPLPLRIFERVFIVRSREESRRKSEEKEGLGRRREEIANSVRVSVNRRVSGEKKVRVESGK